jgi:hypothetical protein
LDAGAESGRVAEVGGIDADDDPAQLGEATLSPLLGEDGVDCGEVRVVAAGVLAPTVVLPEDPSSA